MACRSNVPDVNVDGTVGIRNEPGAVADAVPVDRIRHKPIPRIAYGERPEGMVRRELSRRKVHDVVVRTGQPLARAIYSRRPVHRLLRHVNWARKCQGARASQQSAIAGLTASVHGGPAVDLRHIGVREDLERDECQHATNDDALHDVRCDGSAHDKKWSLYRLYRVRFGSGVGHAWICKQTGKSATENPCGPISRLLGPFRS